MRAITCINTDFIMRKRDLMVHEIKSYVPEFDSIFTYEAPQFAVKTKMVGRHDSRSCTVERDGNIFSIFSGKIDTIFHAADEIISNMGVDL